MKRLLAFFALPLVLAACLDHQPAGPAPLNAAAAAYGEDGAPGTVYVLSNAASNAVLVFSRATNGALGAPVSVPTGGAGTGGGLGNQGALALSANERFLYAVNAGSDEISAFAVTPQGLVHLGNVASGGDQPISVALNGDLLYALNDGTSPDVSGFRVGTDGSLTPIPGSARPLSSAVPDAAQVGISPDGTRLVVTEKATNLIVSWDIGRDGLLSHRTLTPSSSPTPFGFDFDPRGVLIVSEAVGGAVDASVLSSYVPTAGGWTAVSPSTATTETAACWVVVTPNGNFVYTTNAGSASVSGFAVGHGGGLALLDADGKTGNTDASPVDAATTGNGRYLYNINNGSHTITGFRIGADGSLDALGSVGVIPAGASGIVAR